MANWLDKYDVGGEIDPDKSFIDSAKKALSFIGDITSIPARSMVKGITGKYEDPSQAFGITNPVGAYLTDAIFDPTNLIGAGVAAKVLKGAGKATKVAKAIDIADRIANTSTLDRMAIAPKNIPIDPTYFNKASNATIDALTQRGQQLDRITSGKLNLTPDDIYYHGTYSGRPVVQVNTPTGPEYFYKSTGWGGKDAGQGTWQVYGQHMDAPGVANNWFVKGQNYKNWYGSQTFKNTASQMDNLIMQKYGLNPTDVNKFLNFQNIQSNVNTFVPKQKNGGWLDKYADGGQIHGAKVDPIKINGTEVFEHGEDTATAQHEENGVGPTDLTPKGEKYAEKVGKHAIMANKRAVISSDIERAKQTANVIAGEAGIEHYVNPVLNTWNIGEFDGAPEGSFKEKDYIKNPDKPVPGGESFNDFKQRMQQAFHFAENAPKDDQIITHSKVTRAFKALHETGGKWTDRTTKKFIQLKDAPKKKAYNGVKTDNYGKEDNYNDYSTYAPQGFQGDGYSNEGRDYSPAWGGQFDNGGILDLFKGKFAKFKETLPPNLANTPNRDYDMRYFWKHSGKPQNFEAAQAMDQPMFSLEEDGYHAPSVEPTTGRFLKPKHHSTLYKELEWYNSEDPNAVEFRKTHDLDTTGKYYQYVPKKEMQNGGDLSFISDPKLRTMLEGYKPGFMDTVGDYRLPEGRMAGSINPSSEVSTSIGGEGGEPGYLIPTFKYGQPLQDPIQEFNMTGQHLGGPFKTWQDAEKFQELRHQYVEKGQPLPSPIATSNMAMGGSIPGSVGFTYARTNSPAPSEGKYAKKTLPSAENGTEMQFYQHGLDWRPRSMADGGDIVPGENEEVQLPTEFLDTFDFIEPDDPFSAKLRNDLVPVEEKHFTPGMEDKFDIMESMWSNKSSQFLRDWDAKNKIDTTGAKNIRLNTGRFRGAKVPSTIIDELAETSRKQNVPLGQLLTLMGRESTFGSGTSANEERALDKSNLMSGWNVAEQYQPYLHIRFLADNKVPGVKARPTPHGYEYEVTDEKAMNDYIRKNPKLIDQYKAKLDSTRSVGNQDAFDLAAKFLKKKGIQGYNPGDPGYVKDFNTDYNLLKQDKGLMNYVKQKGYQFENGGSLELTKLDQLTNFTNYNTKQPGGWLDKYQ